ncbi:MAG: group III truncated hemoglobin [Hyphomonadaceae bacterium]|nr:group III truncated hemoglobin [Hyphomonadaceae bacterium]
MTLEPITEDDIARLTKVFYATVRKDDLLGPVFNGKIGTDDQVWNEHIEKINGFWSNIFLKTGRYMGNPMAKHVGLPEITPAHFTRWLTLFKAAGAKTLPERKQALFDQTANRIARSFQMSLAFHFDKDDTKPNPFEELGLKRPSVRAAKGLD